MLPYMMHNDWCLFDSKTDNSQLLYETVLLYDKNINNEYHNNFAIGRIVTEKNKKQDALFEELKVILEPTNDDYDPVELDGYPTIESLNSLLILQIMHLVFYFSQ